MTVSFPSIIVYNVLVSDLLLQTKLFKPTLRPSLIARPQLIDRLNDGLGNGENGFSARLALVSAPAGFGKTTLVAAWLAQLIIFNPEFSGQDAAWLSLDENDNDLVRFLAYLIAALQTVVPAIGQAAVRALQSPQPPGAETILTLLINDLAQSERPIILVLDDYHVVTLPSIHQALAYLLEHMPPHLHLLIITRSAPPLPLSRLRARSQIVEIRADDLRFNLEETNRFFNQVMGLKLSGEETEALEMRTEGWIAGLQLAALSMQGRDDLPDFIRDFAGSQRLILDYLTDEVLERRPKGTRNFLLQTSILGRFCGPLCDAVTGHKDSQATMERLERANLFLIPLDEGRYWYRYHHLFADVLRTRLRQASASQTNGIVAPAELHSRASAWFEREGLIGEAIQHALAVPDLERAAALVERFSVVMFQRSEIFITRTWLERLPSRLVQTRPRLILAQGWAKVLTGHGRAIEEWLSAPQTSAVLCAPDLPAEILGELALIRATQARYQREDARSLALALQAKELLADDERGLLAGALYTIAVAHLHQGDVATASRAFAETAVVGETKGGPYMALAALQELSELQLRQGHLSQVLQTCHKSMHMAARWGWQSMPAAGMAHIYLGHVYYQRNDLTRALHELSDGIERLRGSTDQDVLAPGYVTLSQIHMARGDYEGALTTIAKGEDWLTEMQLGDRGAGTHLALGRIRLWLRHGRLRAAARWFDTCRWWAEDTNIGYLQRLALVRLRLAQSRLDPQLQVPAEVSEMLSQLLTLKEGGEWFGQVTELLLLQALVCQAQGDSTGALTLLERAFGLAEPEGYVRLLADEGEPMADLLRRARLSGLFPRYVDRLLAAFGIDRSEPLAAEFLPEPLSERELEVLRLVAMGATNRDIAGELFIALPTVKKHVGHILVKLDTSNRVQAVARARELGLLS